MLGDVLILPTTASTITTESDIFHIKQCSFLSTRVMVHGLEDVNEEYHQATKCFPLISGTSSYPIFSWIILFIMYVPRRLQMGHLTKICVCSQVKCTLIKYKI